MPASATTISVVQQILKNQYLAPVRKQITDEVTLYQQFQRNSEDVTAFSGTTQLAVISVHKGRNPSVSFQTEDGTLPDAGAQKWDRLTYTLKSQYGRLQLTGQALSATKNNAGAFARALERELDGLVLDFKFELNRVLNGDGSGTLTLINGAATAAAQTVDSTRFLHDEMLVKIDTDDVKISTVDSDTGITLSTSITTADNDTVKRRVGASSPAEANGIANIVDSTGTIGGVSATGNLWWQSIELSNATDRDLTLDLMQQLWRRVEERKNDGPDFFFGKHVIRDMYLRQLVADRRWVNVTPKGTTDPGMLAAEYNGRPFMTDLHATDKTLYALTKKHFNIFESGDINWMDDDGAILSRVQNQDAYEATLKYYWELGADNRRFQGKATNLNEA